MDKIYKVRMYDGAMTDCPGLDAPVPGLAVVRTDQFACHNDLFAILHVRSGTGVLFAHSPELFSETVWDRLSAGPNGPFDWTRSGPEVEADDALFHVVTAAQVQHPGGLYIGPRADQDHVEVPAPETRVGPMTPPFRERRDT